MVKKFWRFEYAGAFLQKCQICWLGRWLDLTWRWLCCWPGSDVARSYWPIPRCLSRLSPAVGSRSKGLRLLLVRSNLHHRLEIGRLTSLRPEVAGMSPDTMGMAAPTLRRGCRRGCGVSPSSRGRWGGAAWGGEEVGSFGNPAHVFERRRDAAGVAQTPASFGRARCAPVTARKI